MNNTQQEPVVPNDLKQKLLKESMLLLKKSYSPYSKFSVGAIIIDQDDNWYRGVNVENLSYGLTVCAERSAVSEGVLQGLKKIKYVCVIGDTPGPLAPCGACRQTLFEFSTPDTIIIMSNIKQDLRIVTMDQLLPFAFSLSDLKNNLQNKESQSACGQQEKTGTPPKPSNFREEKQQRIQSCDIINYDENGEKNSPQNNSAGSGNN